MVRHMYYSAYHFGDTCKPRLHTKALRERFTSNKQQAQEKLYLYHWISKRIHLGNPLLESQQFFEGAICPTVGDYTGIMSQVLSSTMLLIGAMITVYSHKLKINNISAFEQSYIQTVVSGTRHISKIENHVTR